MVTVLASRYAETLMSPRMGIALCPCSQPLAVDADQISSFVCVIRSLVVTLVACSCCYINTSSSEESDEDCMYREQTETTVRPSERVQLFTGKY